MVPQNGQLQAPRPPQQTPHAGFSNFMTPTAALDPSFIDSPQVAKQMAALAAANHARISQNSRPPSQLSSTGGTSGPFAGPINNAHTYPSGSQDFLNNSVNGLGNFQLTNNLGIQQNHSMTTNSFPDPSMSQSNMSNMSRPPTAMNNPLKLREMNFLQGLANTFAKRGNPLPPGLTGVSFPNYDPNTSQFSVIEPGSEVGTFRLAGKDVNIFKFWGLALQQGGGQAVEHAKLWPAFLPHLGLPEEYTDPQTNTPTPVAKLLRDHYMTFLLSFEQLYKKNIQDQQKKLQMNQGQGLLPDQQFLPRQNPGMSSIQQSGMRPMSSNGIPSQNMSSTNGLGQFLPTMPNQQRPPHTAGDSHSSIASADLDTLAHPVDTNLLDHDMQGIKRKHESDGGVDAKRVRQKTDPPDGNSMAIASTTTVPSTPVKAESQPPASMTAQRPRQQPTRRKIEYVPLAREGATYGGRDVHAIDAEWTNQMSRRPLRDINEWGVVDTEHLSMSLRSRLAIELSYALTTFTVLSTMRAQAPGSGFPIYNCPDLLDDALDLMEELAFEGPESDSIDKSERIYTNRELVALVQDDETRPFASLGVHQGSKDPSLGPMQRPGNIIISVVAIVRNLSIVPDNVDFLASFPRLADRLLRLCMLERAEGGLPKPASGNLSLADLLLVRREVINIFINLAGFIHLSTTFPPSTTHRIARRIFELIASYLVDPAESIPPLASVQVAGVPPDSSLRPPQLADMALEVFTRISQTDANRQLLAKAIPQPILWQLVTSLVHRVPLVDADFMLMQRDYWASFVEKTIMGIYALIFMAPYELKQKIKADRSLRIKNVLLRMAQRVLLLPNLDGRAMYMIPARRAVEAMKLLDKAEERVDAAEPTKPALQFGMGFSDGDDNSLEKGTGLLGANRDAAWEMLMMRDVLMDDIFFNELDSLVRVECS